MIYTALLSNKSTPKRGKTEHFAIEITGVARNFDWEESGPKWKNFVSLF